MPLLDPAALKALSVRSDRIGAIWLARHLALVAALGVAVAWARPSVWAWPAMLALGIAEMSLFAPLHETTHRTPFRSLWLNRAVGWAIGFVLLLPPEWFRLFHLAHHRHTQDPAHDPEIAGAAPLTPRGYAWRLTGLPYWWAQVRVVLAWAGGRAQAPYVAPAAWRAVVSEARAYLAAYLVLAALSVATGSTWALWLWIVPALLGQPVLRAFLMAEHAGLPFVPDRLANTRTTNAGGIVRRLFWNANHHVEHHAAPGVPFHALPRLHALMRPNLTTKTAGYVAAHKQVRGRLPWGGQGAVGTDRGTAAAASARNSG